MKQSKSRKYKALMSDIDGTLILNNPHALPSQKIIDAVKKASRKIHVGVATSRPFHHAERIINSLSITAPCIVGGGSQIVDPKTKKIIWEKRLKPDEIIKINNILVRDKINIELIDDLDNTSVPNDNYKNPLQVWSPGIDNITADKIIKSLSEIESIAINKVPSYNKGHVALVITNINATKLHGILEFAEILNLKTKDIIGIGDGENDYSLLMACGLKIAMGNAVPELKEIADYIAPPVEEDGVADVIERFVLNETIRI